MTDLEIGSTFDPDTNVITVVLDGLLDLRTAPAVRGALNKSLAQCPDAVVVDLARLRVDERSRLTVFPAAARSQPGSATLLLLAGADGDLAALTAGRVLGGVRLYGTHRQAVDAVVRAEAGFVRRVELLLPPDPASVTRARHTTAQACQAWDINQVADSAAIIVTELVANAVEHASTDIGLSIAVRGDYLHLRVNDRDSTPPVVTDLDSPLAMATADRGRGLHLVQLSSTAWGVTAAAKGKTVWATLRVGPPAA